MKSFKIPSLKPIRFLKPYRFVLGCLLIAYALNSCSLLKDAAPQLPPITQEGKNTFGCLVNGKVWNAYFGSTDWLNTPATEAKYDPFRQGQLSIRASQNKEASSIIYISILETPLKKIYDFVRADSFQIGDMRLGYSLKNTNSDNQGCSYITSSLTYFKGKTIITKFDLQNRIAAGTFEFRLKSKNCLDTLIVTQGRFDMKF
jgi:hypothetical protein